MEHRSEGHEERERTSIARNQNVLYLLPHDAAAITEFLEPALERLEPGEGELQLLVLTPDAETAVAVAETVTRAPVAAGARVLPITTPRRAARLIAERPPSIVAGSPSVLLELVRGAAIKLGATRSLIIAWADAIAELGQMEALEALMAEVPKDAARSIVATHMNPAVEAVVERYARRARRSGEVEVAGGESVDLRYVVVAPQSHPAAIRRLLDDLDPERAAVYARSDAGAAEVERTLRALGYAGRDAAAVVTRGEPVPGATLVVLHELPPTREALRAVAGSAMPIALVTPRQLSTLRTLAGAGRMTPYTLSGAPARARTREERVREELRATLAEEGLSRELLAIEPLLNEYDGAEIASAALRLLERERQRQREQPAAAAGGGAPAFTRIFINAGARDNIAARDLVGAIANEAGIPGDRIGKVDVRDTHALVDIAADAAAQVVERLTGVVLRGRRVIARLESDRPPRDRPDRAMRGERPERGERAPRRDRGDRGDRGERGERPRRDDNASRPPRPPRPPRPSSE
ncbi:MAG TPA: DbpA RNA binding domain-containing protein [Gemmatimonadaceae bacterium]